jgi:outer membrane protein
LVQSRHDEYVAGAVLLSAMGLLEVQFLFPGSQNDSSTKSFARVKNIGAPPWADAIGLVDGVGVQRTLAPALSEPGAGRDRPDGTPSMPKPTP